MGLLWPLLGGDFPPGVDTPTFLHLSWVTRLALTGHLENPLLDPYWYGGFRYLQSYPPLAYGLVGAISALWGDDLVGVYRGMLVLAYVGTVWATVWVARQIGLPRGTSLLAGLLVVVSYPVLAALALWGWFTTLAALPLVVMAYGLLERSLSERQVRWGVLGGVCFGLGALAHHMTALGIGLALVPWGVYHLVRGTIPRLTFLKVCAVFLAVALVVVAPWGVPFLAHALEVGFRREMPGIWTFPLATYARHALLPAYIGRFIYPAYIGASVVFFALVGVVYALLEGRRLPALALLTLTLTAFSLGVEGNPLYRLYPFSGLDAARFSVFMAPFVALLCCVAVDAVAHSLEGWRVLRARPVIRRMVLGLVVAALVALPLRDAWIVRGKMAPYQVDPQVHEALTWLAHHTHPQDRVFSAGMWFWDTFLIPYLAQRPLVHGWHDEGAPTWRAVGVLRGAAWFGLGTMDGVASTLRTLGARYVVVAESLFTPEATPLLRERMESRPDLFTLQAQWERVRIYQVR
ncbi:MAG: hypothetical protein NZ951_06880 [Dehalococcoidia bacterium]|nr:hypothetical protein [Dehalococcoidia bacterium]MDW8120490.1 hypothetical protein [Chloroflexota bacterium]